MVHRVVFEVSPSLLKLIDSSLLLCEFEYQYGVKHNAALVSFWVFSATLGGIRVNAMALEADDYGVWDDNSLPFIIAEMVRISTEILSDLI